MRVDRRGSNARRIAIGLIAMLGLLLQSLLASPAPPFEASGTEICIAQTSADQEAPGDRHGGHHGLCCILACVACNVALAAAIAGIVDFPEPPGSRIALSHAAAIPPSAPLKFYFAARGPPNRASIALA